MYTITVHNSQGASDQKSNLPTKAAVKSYLATWSDPENLTARITDDRGNVVGEKSVGRKTITWTN